MLLSITCFFSQKLQNKIKQTQRELGRYWERCDVPCTYTEDTLLQWAGNSHSKHTQPHGQRTCSTWPLRRHRVVAGVICEDWLGAAPSVTLGIPGLTVAAHNDLEWFTAHICKTWCAARAHPGHTETTSPSDCTLLWGKHISLIPKHRTGLFSLFLTNVSMLI